MAKISKESIFKLEKHRNSIHAPTQCSYTVFYSNNGDKHFQIDTYGTTERANPDKIS